MNTGGVSRIGCSNLQVEGLVGERDALLNMLLRRASGAPSAATAASGAPASESKRMSAQHQLQAKGTGAAIDQTDVGQKKGALQQVNLLNL